MQHAGSSGKEEDFMTHGLGHKTIKDREDGYK
jgi:hypothetical protein